MFRATLHRVLAVLFLMPLAGVCQVTAPGGQQAVLLVRQALTALNGTTQVTDISPGRGSLLLAHGDSRGMKSPANRPQPQRGGITSMPPLSGAQSSISAFPIPRLAPWAIPQQDSLLIVKGNLGLTAYDLRAGRCSSERGAG